MNGNKLKCTFQVSLKAGLGSFSLVTMFIDQMNGQLSAWRFIDTHGSIGWESTYIDVLDPFKAFGIVVSGTHTH